MKQRNATAADEPIAIQTLTILGIIFWRTFRLLAETEEKSSRLVVCTFEEYDAGCVNLFLQEFVEIWDFEGGFGEKCVNERHILQDWACQKSSKTLEKVRISRVYRQEI